MASFSWLQILDMAGTRTLVMLGLGDFPMEWILLELIYVITELLKKSTNVTKQPSKNVSTTFTSLFFIKSSITKTLQ